MSRCILEGVITWNSLHYILWSGCKAVSSVVLVSISIHLLLDWFCTQEHKFLLSSTWPTCGWS